MGPFTAMYLQTALLALLLTALSLAPRAEGLNITLESPSKLPPFINRCSIKDPELGKCIVEQGNKAIPILVKGIPQMRLPSLDPLAIDEILIETGRRPTSFRMFVTNVAVTGFAEATLLHMNPDFKNQVYISTISIPHLVIKGEYEVEGRVLILPISGKGKFVSTFDGAKMDYNVSYVLRKRADGKIYHEIPGSNGIFSTTSAHFQMENLFNGDKRLSDQVHTFVNENWRDVLDEMGQPFVDAAIQIVDHFGNQLSKSITYEELFSDVDLNTLEQTQKVIT